MAPGLAVAVDEPALARAAGIEDEGRVPGERAARLGHDAVGDEPSRLRPRDAVLRERDVDPADGLREQGPDRVRPLLPAVDVDDHHEVVERGREDDEGRNRVGLVAVKSGHHRGLAPAQTRLAELPREVLAEATRLGRSLAKVGAGDKYLGSPPAHVGLLHVVQEQVSTRPTQHRPRHAGTARAVAGKGLPGSGPGARQGGTELLPRATVVLGDRRAHGRIVARHPARERADPLLVLGVVEAEEAAPRRAVHAADSGVPVVEAARGTRVEHARRPREASPTGAFDQPGRPTRRDEQPQRRLLERDDALVGEVAEAQRPVGEEGPAGSELDRPRTLHDADRLARVADVARGVSLSRAPERRQERRGEECRSARPPRARGLLDGRGDRPSCSHLLTYTTVPP